MNMIASFVKPWGFRLQLEKCKFYTPVVKYIGFKGDPTLITIIKHLRRPSDQKEVSTFLVVVNYYGKFINQLYKLKSPF